MSWGENRIIFDADSAEKIELNDFSFILQSNIEILMCYIVNAADVPLDIFEP